jgi:elongation factor 1-gamma
MGQLRIFSYLPNPRVWKAVIAARLCGVDIELRGAPPDELRDWLWDFDARPVPQAERASMSDYIRTGRTGFKGGQLLKTDSFLKAIPFGSVPAAFSPDGLTGIFESNSIMRAVARLGQDGLQIYGGNPYESSRVDSFLDASLVFARDSQAYLLALRSGADVLATHARAVEAFATYMSGIEEALRPGQAYLVGEDLTLADISFACELCLFSNERLRDKYLKEASLQRIFNADTEHAYSRAVAHFHRLLHHPAFAPEMMPYMEKLGPP